jgi:hypothetical protein
MAAAVRVSLKWWGTHRALTTEQKEEFRAATVTDTRFLTAGKKLVDTRHEAFRKLTKVKSRLGSYWRGMTLPFTEPGMRLISQSDIESFVHKMEGFREELNEAAANFASVYEQVKADARQRLGRLYNPDDYPTNVQSLFSVEWDFPSVEPPKYLMRLNHEIYEEERRRVAARFEEAVRLAEQAFATEFSKLLSHLTERLANSEDGQRKVFRDSAVANLREFFGRFAHLNVRSNPELDALVEEAQRLVQNIGPQDLRDNESLRQQVANDMTRVQAQVEGLIVDAPRRRIIRARPSGNGGPHDPAA